MKNKKNILFFILFLLYIFIFLFTYRHLGENVFYASLPMILGASILYGYVAAFAVIALNIPATLVFFYVFGTPFADSIKFINPFIILLQCVCVVIPGMVKLYYEKIESIKFKDYVKKLDALMSQMEEKKKESETFRIEAQMYKDMLEGIKDKDQQTGMLSREGLIKLVYAEVSSKKKRAYIVIRLKKIDQINKKLGFFKGDEYINKMANELFDMNVKPARATGACFIVIDSQDKISDIYARLMNKYSNELDLYKDMIKDGDTIAAIINRVEMK